MIITPSIEKLTGDEAIENSPGNTDFPSQTLARTIDDMKLSMNIHPLKTTQQASWHPPSSIQMLLGMSLTGYLTILAIMIRHFQINKHTSQLKASESEWPN